MYLLQINTKNNRVKELFLQEHLLYEEIWHKKIIKEYKEVCHNITDRQTFS